MQPMSDFFDGMPIPPDNRGDFSQGVPPPFPHYVFAGYMPIGDGEAYIGLWVDPDRPIESERRQSVFAEAEEVASGLYEDLEEAFNYFDPFRTLTDFPASNVRGNGFSTLEDAVNYLQDRGLSNIAVIIKDGRFYYVVVDRSS